ncbi:hypothetical protein VKT23_013991 [Stygiomarasmius scandens]|uniref:Uncharacterized protein n=1 Tax=Marasmiellus scandens TaxID=2682957 RepID=A0ABR1J1Z1_9AGAR
MGGLVLHDGDKFVGTLDEQKLFDRPIAIAVAKNQGGELFIDEPEEDIVDRRQKAVLDSRKEGTLNYILKYNSREEKGKIHSTDTLLGFLIQTKLISITKGEIMDRSKRDPISKIFGVGQTVWFVVQCMARGVRGFSISNLEILTLAFAMLNFATYFLWWNKPQRVRYPVKINVSGYRDVKVPSQTLRRPPERHNSLGAIGEAVRLDWESSVTSKFSYIPAPIRIITYPLLSLLIQCISLIFDSIHYETRLQKDRKRVYVLVILLAVAFGAIHCIPWSFKFPTPVERTIWRICALGVTLLPILGILVIVLDELGAFPNILEYVVAFTTLWILPLLYMAARIILIVVALMELRSLPPDAYSTVNWTNLLPHI